MGEFAGQGCFDQKQLVKTPALFFIAERVGSHQLYGHLTACEGIVGKINRAGRSPAELLDDLVFADLVHERIPGGFRREYGGPNYDMKTGAEWRVYSFE